MLDLCVKVSKELSKRLDAGGNLQLSADVGGESGPLLGHHLVTSIALGVHDISSPSLPPHCLRGDHLHVNISVTNPCHLGHLQQMSVTDDENKTWHVS